MNHAPLADRRDHSIVASPPGHRAIDAFLWFWLFVSTGALFPLLVSGGRAHIDDDASAMLRLLLLPGVAIAPVLLWAKAREITALLNKHPVLIALLLWVWASTFWSIDPAISIRRALILTTNSIIVCYIVVRYEPIEIIRKLFWICILQLGLSILFALIVTDLAFMPDDGRLRGIFTHKSVLGQMLVISSLIFLLIHKEQAVSPYFIVVGSLLIFILLIFSHSVTSYLLILLLFMLVFTTKTVKIQPIVAGICALFGLSFLGVVFLLSILFIDDITAMLGRDATLTGRTGIWAYMLHYIEKRPVLGYGYRAFFNHPVYADAIRHTFLFNPTGSHNGYLETALDLGVIGLALVVIFLMSGLMSSVQRMSGGGTLGARFGVFWLSLYAVRNIAESDLLSQSHLSWTLTLLAVLWLRRSVGFPMAVSRDADQNPDPHHR